MEILFHLNEVTNSNIFSTIYICQFECGQSNLSFLHIVKAHIVLIIVANMPMHLKVSNWNQCNKAPTESNNISHQIPQGETNQICVVSISHSLGNEIICTTNTLLT